jgi:hypothetical protein
MASYEEESAILLETVGLLMEYAALVGDRGLFDLQHELVRHAFTGPNGLLAWRVSPDLSRRSSSTATIDELKVVGALLDGAIRWEDPTLERAARDIAETVLEQEVVRGVLVHAASWDEGSRGVTRSDRARTAYLDLDTLSRLAAIDARWTPVYENSLAILERVESPLGLFPDETPLDVHRPGNRWEADPEEIVNGIHVLYCALHLAEVSKGGGRTLAFLERQFQEKGRLGGRWRLGSGDEIPGYENVSVYALAARLARSCGRRDLARAFLNRMLDYELLDPVKVRPEGPPARATRSVFDNLHALIAIRSLT